MKNENILALSRVLRERLDRMHVQFGHNVGVTDSALNPWQNGKRAAQLFVVPRLLRL